MDDNIEWEDLRIIFTDEFIDILKMIYANEDSILRLAKKRLSAIREVENMLKDIEEREKLYECKN